MLRPVFSALVLTIKLPNPLKYTLSPPSNEDFTSSIKVSTVACILQGTMAATGPKQTNEQYGVSDELNDDIELENPDNLNVVVNEDLNNPLYDLNRNLLVAD